LIQCKICFSTIWHTMFQCVTSWDAKRWIWWRLGWSKLFYDLVTN
jgi:hypothetical protein